MSEYVAWLNRVAREEYKYMNGGHSANPYGDNGPLYTCSVCKRQVCRNENTRSGWMHRPVRRPGSSGSKRIKPIKCVAEYMALHHPEYADRPPIIYEARNENGWHRYPMFKRVSVSWLRKMRAEGYTWVGLSPDKDGIFVADFSITELLKGA